MLDQNNSAIVAARLGRIEEVRAALNGGLPASSCTEYGQTLLSEALDRGHIDVAIEVLRRDFDPTLTYKDASSGEYREIGMNPLSIASKLGNEEVVDLLLGKGARAVSRHFGQGYEYSGAIQAAIENKHSKILRKLLSTLEDDVRKQELARNSHQYLSACTETQSIEMLISAGANVHQLVGKRSVLHKYAKDGWKEGLTCLLNAGADPTIRDSSNSTPEHYAKDTTLKNVLRVAELKMRVEKWLLDGRPKAVFPVGVMEIALTRSEEDAVKLIPTLSPLELAATDGRGYSLLTYAIRYKLYALSEALVDAGADPNQSTDFGSSIVAFAAGTGNGELVKKLLKAGGRVDSAEGEAAPAIVIAVQNKDMPMVQLLLENGARVEPAQTGDENQKWESVLMIGAATGNVALAELLLHHGGNIHAANWQGEGVVKYAVGSDNLEMVKWAVLNGANPGLRDHRGHDAFIMAALRGNLEILKYLGGLGLYRDDVGPYLRGDVGKAREYLKTLQHEQNSMKSRDFWCRDSITTEDVAAYISRGDDVNKSDVCPTPLQAMALAQNLEAVRLLLGAGADATKRGRSITPPVFLAFGARSPGDDQKTLQLLKLFLQNGISPNQQNYLLNLEGPQEETPSGDTLLMEALDRGFVQCSYYLMEAGADPAKQNRFGKDAFDSLIESGRLSEQERYQIGAEMKRRAPHRRERLKENPPAVSPLPARL